MLTQKPVNGNQNCEPPLRGAFNKEMMEKVHLRLDPLVASFSAASIFWWMLFLSSAPLEHSTSGHVGFGCQGLQV